jgi:hypothetical protein
MLIFSVARLLSCSAYWSERTLSSEAASDEELILSKPEDKELLLSDFKEFIDV